MAVCYIGIGSNLGSRLKNIKLALEEIKHLKQTKIIKMSKIIETLPLGGPAKQAKFLNAVLEIETNLKPLVLLKNLKNIERKLGRTKTVRFGPRVIDLDILFYEDKVINRKELKVPHPRIFERDFVIKPLLELLCR